MADTLTTTTEIDPAVATYYDRVLLVRAKPAVTYERFAQKRPIPAKSGNTIKFRRYTNLSTATTPLSEGVTPPGSALAKTDLTAQVAQYGDYVHLTDIVDFTVEDRVMNETSSLQAQQRAETRNEILRDILVATASQSAASGGSNGNTPTEVTQSDLKSIYVTLRNNNALMFTNVQAGGSGVGTSPVRPAYWGICRTELIDDLEDVSSFRSVSEYPSPGVAEMDEEGSTDNIRWLVSSIAYKSTDSPAQYQMHIIGQNSYGVTDLAGAASTIIKPFGAGDDPLNQRASMGWKDMFVARILNDTFMHALVVTHS